MIRSANGLSYDFHCVLEGLHALRQIIYDLVLIVETLIHFVFEGLTQALELGHRLALEFFNILMLLLELATAVVFECSKLKRLISSLFIYLLMQFVLRIVNLLHNVFLALDTGLALAVELVLQVYMPENGHFSYI